MSQATRYNTLYVLTGKSNLDCAYHAAFYLLSGDRELYEVACKCVTHDGIDFSKIKRNTRDFDERTRFVVDIAHNLFSYSSPCKATPYEISRLGYPLMEQVCNALYIATGSMEVLIQLDENQKLVMTLDTTPYEKEKNFQKHLASYWVTEEESEEESEEEQDDDWER